MKHYIIDDNGMFMSLDDLFLVTIPDDVEMTESLAQDLASTNDPAAPVWALDAVSYNLAAKMGCPGDVLTIKESEFSAGAFPWDEYR